MSIDDLIESIGLPAVELRRYLVDEVDEFLAAGDRASQDEEFGDVLFALLATAWAHTGRHLPLDTRSFEAKIRTRLRHYGALTRYPRKYGHDQIPEIPIGVVHFAFGQFTGQWTEFEDLKNGTVAEIHLLTEAPFRSMDARTNQCIITFDATDGIEYSIIQGAPEIDSGNILLCRIPDFMYRRAKRELRFSALAPYLSLQVLGALDGLRIISDPIAHFHSWESGFLTDSEEFGRTIDGAHTIFSPYLTVGGLGALMNEAAGSDWTLSPAEVGVAEAYERKLAIWSQRVVLESERDRAFYRQWVPDDRLEMRSFARDLQAEFPTDAPDPTRLTFVAGGRAVREKGFVELCREFVAVRDWATRRGIDVSLAILCRDRRPEKGAGYIGEIERAIVEGGLGGVVAIEPKVSLDALKRRIASASAVIAPSLYDPYCLLPTYAVEARRPAFVSRHAGVAENIESREFTFDPLVEGDLARSVARWFDEKPPFRFASRFPSYRGLYLETGASWA
ncbi:MAG: hypothetical protein AB7Q29_16345 [Vicinamibacterales bacterium]